MAELGGQELYREVPGRLAAAAFTGTLQAVGRG